MYTAKRGRAVLIALVSTVRESECHEPFFLDHLMRSWIWLGCSRLKWMVYSTDVMYVW